MTAAVLLRKVAPTYKVWEDIAHGYQRKAREHLTTTSSAALWLGMGLGKTSIVLNAFLSLRAAGKAKSMLIIAPMRVCQLVWRQEAKKWLETLDIRIANLAGRDAKTRENLLRADADIWLINPESVPWLCGKYPAKFGGVLPFDIVCIDELTSFKNSQSVRFKGLAPLMDKVKYRWGLTGTPAPNGHMDLFGQIRILDGGAAFGKYITHYRDRFFDPGRDGFSYELRRGADKAIEQAIEPYIYQASSEDYLDMPDLIDNDIRVDLPVDKMKIYRQMKNDMLTKLGEGATITAANAAATYNKLQQMASGQVYDEDHNAHEIHSGKIEALQELVEGLGDAQLLVAYAFNHEVGRLLEVFPDAAFLGGGVKAARAEEIERDWNSGKIRLLFAHPASVGHGLNFQLSGASNVCWFTLTWDLGLYEQLIARIYRQGNTATKIVNHRIIVNGTIDELVVDALEDKCTTQNALLSALKSELIGDRPPKSNKEPTTMALTRRIQTQPTTVATQPDDKAAASWGNLAQTTASGQPAVQKEAPAGWGSAAASTNDQREQIEQKLSGQGVDLTNFPQTAQSLDVPFEADPPKAASTRKKASAVEVAEPQPIPYVQPHTYPTNVNLTIDAAAILALFLEASDDPETDAATFILKLQTDAVALNN